MDTREIDILKHPCSLLALSHFLVEALTFCFPYLLRRYQLQIHLLGSIEVRLGERSLTFPHAQDAGSVDLPVARVREQPREHLAALLWLKQIPNAATPRSATPSVTCNLLYVRQAVRLQTDYILITHNALALNPDADIHLDLHTVERAYALARADRSNRTPPESPARSAVVTLSAAACYRGRFSRRVFAWQCAHLRRLGAVQREMWGRRLSLILDRLSEIQFAQGELASTAETAAQWIALDALNEVAYRRKMRAHFAAGERGQALETYKACRAVLAAELNVEPGAGH